MKNPKRTSDPQELLRLMDDYLVALYHDRHDPKRPPELTDRICRVFRPTDLPNAR